MSSEIEAKRKELTSYNYPHDELTNFNLGVEMARKEILKWMKDKSQNWTCDIYRGDLFLKAEELKQSLEENKK